MDLIFLTCLLVAISVEAKTDPIKIAKPFNDKILPVRQQSGEPTEHLGHVLRLNTLLAPKEVESIHTKFSFYNRHQTVEDITFEVSTRCFVDSCNEYQYDLTKINAIDFDPNKRTIIIIPGYLTDEKVDWMTECKDLWLKLEDVNVFLVTWSDSNRFLYSRAVANTPFIGRQITIFLYYLAELKGFWLREPSFMHSIHIVGHSLGSHIAGLVGQDFDGQIGRITGLDVAGPSFDTMPHDHRLDKRDAILVDTIHTNRGRMRYLRTIVGSFLNSASNMISKMVGINPLLGKEYASEEGNTDSSWFGIDVNIGHIDYYANNGKLQPGCDDLFHICDHGRAHEIYRAVLIRELRLRELDKKSYRPELYRLRAFKSRDFDQFTSGNFQWYCPSPSSNEPHDETSALNQCTVPIDFVKPALEFREELEKKYQVSFDDDSSKNRNYFFRTQSSFPFVGDHYVLKLRLDGSSIWESNCALLATIKMVNNENIFKRGQKPLRTVRSDNSEMFHMMIPFVNPFGADASYALHEILVDSQINTQVNRRHLDEQLYKALPIDIELSLFDTNREGVTGSLKNYMESIIMDEVEPEDDDDDSLYPPMCQVAIISAEIFPLTELDSTLIGLYRPESSASSPLDSMLKLEEYEKMVIGQDKIILNITMTNNGEKKLLLDSLVLS